MREPDDDTLLFFDAHRDALPLFAALEETIFERFPEAKKRVQKTQITYYHRHVFACVSFARVKRRAELPEGWLTLTLGLPYPLESGRVAVKTEVYPGRWTTHFVIGSKEELDGNGWNRPTLFPRAREGFAHETSPLDAANAPFPGG